MLPVWLTDTVTSDLDRAVHYTLLWGLQGVVLRTMGGTGDRVPHVNEARLRRRLEEAELTIAAVDPGLFEASVESRAGWLNDIESLADSAAFCGRVDCDLILSGALTGPSSEPWPRDAASAVLARAAGAAAGFGVRLAVRNAAQSGCASGADLAALLSTAGEACTSDGARAALGAAWSPADSLRAGLDPEEGLDALLKANVNVHYVAVRDGRRDAGEWTDAIPGEGAVGWAHQLSRLAAAGYDGPLALEVHGRPAGAFGLRASTALIQLARAPTRPASLPRP